MNRHAPSTNAESSYPRPEIRTFLRGYWRELARIVWIALVVFILACIIASIPSFNAFLQNECSSATCHSFIAPDTVKQIRAAGVSVTFNLIYIYVLFILNVLTYLAIGSLLFLFKSNDGMALFSSAGIEVKSSMIIFQCQTSAP